MERYARAVENGEVHVLRSQEGETYCGGIVDRFTYPSHEAISGRVEMCGECLSAKRAVDEAKDSVELGTSGSR
jgi:hypothetical protein